MQPNFVRQFQDLALGYRDKEVPEDALQSLVWETFKAYANSLPTLEELPLYAQLDRVVAIMRKRGITINRDAIEKLRAEQG